MRTRRNAKGVVFLALMVIFLTTNFLMWLRSAPVRAQSSTADRLREARTVLEQTKSKERSLKAKEAGRATEAALQEYNAAIEARVAEIFARVKELHELLGANTTSPFDLRDGKSKAKAQDPALRTEYESLQSELAAITPGPSAPGNINSVTESEPNNTSATANTLNLGANGCRVATGAITEGDIDFWSFTAPAGSRVWAYVDTGGGQSSPTNDRDSFLTLFDTNGTTILEEDDDDGTGNGGDSSTESGFASDIAGRPLAAAGTYFLALEGFGPMSVINPYRLFVVVSTGAGSAESEPNDTATTANPGLGGSVVAYKTGSITPAGDVDFFTVTANAGDVFYITGDGNPERDGTNTDLNLDIIHPDKRALMSPPIDSGLGGSATNPEGEAFSFAVPVSGTYALKVSGFSTSTGTYGLLIARCSPRIICSVNSFTGTLGQNSTQYPGVSGTQNGRLNRFVDQTGACNSIRTCPGLFTTVGARPFDAYTFANINASPSCVTVVVDAQACQGNNFLVVAAYLGSYDPANQCTNYLADIGGSPTPSGVFSFNVPGGAAFTLVIAAANASPTVCATPYKVTILGLPTFAFSLQDDVTADTLQFDPVTGRYKLFSCSRGITVIGTGTAAQFGCNQFFESGAGNPVAPQIKTLVNLCTRQGTATALLESGEIFEIHDSNIDNSFCFCP